MLLREVADAQAVAADDATFTIGAFHAGKQFQQGGLTCTVVAENNHPRAFVDSEVYAHENLQRAVHLGQTLGIHGRLAARRRLGELNIGHLIGHADLVELAHHAFSTVEHLLCRGGLGCLGTELGSLLLQCRRLLFRIGTLSATPRFIGSTGIEVLLITHVVDVGLAADRVKEPHLVAHGLQQFDVVGNHNEPALMLGQELAQPRNRVGIQVVSRLIQEQRGLGFAGAFSSCKEDLCQLHAATLAA